MPGHIFPDTNSYMLLGYAVVVSLLTGLVVYLVMKARNLRADIAMLETEEMPPDNLVTDANTVAPQRDVLKAN